MLQPRFCFLAISYQLINETTHLNKLFLRPQDIFTALAPINDEEQRLSGASPSRGNPNGFFDFVYLSLCVAINITMHTIKKKNVSVMGSLRIRCCLSCHGPLTATRLLHHGDLGSASLKCHHLSPEALAILQVAPKKLICPR